MFFERNNCMKRYEWMDNQPIIRFNEIARRVKSKEYAKLLVYRLIKSGRLARITKGLYSTSDDIFSIASNIYFPSYVSGISASYRYGLTEAIPITVSTVTTKKHKTIEYENYRIEFVKSNEVWGYHKEGSNNEIIFIADLEKLFIDAFLYPGQLGNFEEIKNVFENAKNIDVEKLKAYLKKLKSNKIYRQVGYMLEKYNNLDISRLMKIDRNYYLLNPFGKKGKKLDKKWRLFI
jgi:predicted transcriptional regulator of viral defense system